MTNDEREALIRAHLPLVRKIARRIHRLVPTAEFGDLIGDGSVGLIRAVDNFDPERGPALEQYARHLIAGSMLNGIRRMDPVSERARRTMRDGEFARYRIASETGSMPSTNELERLRPGFQRAVLAARRYVPLSLDAPLPEGETLPSDWSTDPASIVMAREGRAGVHALVERLPERQRHVVKAYYFSARSLRDIGASMNISPQRASQLHLAAMKRLRKACGAAAH